MTSNPPGVFFATLLALGAAALAAAAPDQAAAAGARVTIEVPQGKTRSMRLRNLASGTVMSVAVRTNGRLLLALVGARELQASPKNPETLFRGVVERAMSFQVAIPRSGDYYLVLDNRRGSVPLKVQVTIRAKPSAKEPAKPPADGAKDLLRSSGERQQVAQVVVDAQQLAPDARVLPLGEALRESHERRAEPARQPRIL